jgi:hypothetical protein
MKVKFFDQRVFRKSSREIAAVSSALTVILLFIDIPKNEKIPIGLIFLGLLVLIHVFTWWRANHIKEISLNIEGSIVNVKTGDIFEQPGLKAISFNEYFDTLVDDKIIARSSINGEFINSHLDCSIQDLDTHIGAYAFDAGDIEETEVNREAGKTTKFKLGTICVYEDYLLTAFAKFNEFNEARLTMPEYLEFLINFWDRVNRVYAQKSVSTTIFGSGITRITGHKNISDEDLLKIMLWTFRISEMRFKYPAKLTIVIHPDKVDRINLFEIASVRNGV